MDDQTVISLVESKFEVWKKKYKKKLLKDIAALDKTEATTEHGRGYEKAMLNVKQLLEKNNGKRI